MTPQRITIRVSEAPEVFGISTDTIYKWRDAGKIRIHKKGGMSLLKVSDVLAYIESSDE
jgi:excisionase family DNA binding protein